MTGYIRLALALLVLLSHAGVTINGLNPGVIAVVIFYMLAGGVVTHLWHDVLPAGNNKLRRFYQDRLLRIFPLYLYIATLTILFLLITGYSQPHFTPQALLNNALIIPLNYYMVIDSNILGDPSWWLIPQAWSLGAELQAYLLLPLILIYKRLKIALFIISIIIYTAANLNIIHTDYFGYRLLPGVFFIFIIGSIIKESQTAQKISTPMILLSVTAITYSLFAYFNAFKQVYTQETLLGLLIGIPLLIASGRTTIKLPMNKLAASLSYGVFLSHFLVIWFLDYNKLPATDTATYYCSLIMLTIVLSYSGTILIEKRINAVRMRR
jgi:peptidoglycan/LPS O-acetylase OafA/YrhL